MSKTTDIKFTPGPWGAGVLGGDENNIFTDRERIKKAFCDSIDQADADRPCFFVFEEATGFTICYTGNGPTSKSNSSIISHLPDIVAECDRLRARLAEAEGEVAGLKNNLAVSLKTSDETYADLRRWKDKWGYADLALKEQREEKKRWHEKYIDASNERDAALATIEAVRRVLPLCDLASHELLASLLSTAPRSASEETLGRVRAKVDALIEAAKDKARKDPCAAAQDASQIVIMVALELRAILDGADK